MLTRLIVSVVASTAVLVSGVFLVPSKATPNGETPKAVAKVGNCCAEGASCCAPPQECCFVGDCCAAGLDCCVTGQSCCATKTVAQTKAVKTNCCGAGEE